MTQIDDLIVQNTALKQIIKNLKNTDMKLIKNQKSTNPITRFNSNINNDTENDSDSDSDNDMI
jgi:hypothetical protein